jgi:hypothetical protein
MTQAQRAYQLAVRMRQWARTTELPDYAEKMFQVAEDLERQASVLERHGDGTPPLAKAS